MADAPTNPKLVQIDTSRFIITYVVSAIVLHGGEGAGRRVGVVTVGVIAEVFVVFFLGRVLQRLVEQMIESWVAHEEEIFLVFSQDRGNFVDQRFVEQNIETPRVFLWEVGSGGAVLRRYRGSWTNSTHFLRARAVLTGNPGHYFDELLVSGSHSSQCSYVESSELE